MSDGNRLVYILTFDKTARPVKASDPFLDDAEQALNDMFGMETTAEHRGNVTVFAQRGAGLPTPRPTDRTTLDRCLPED